jgi:type VI secretion system protein ImpH
VSAASNGLCHAAPASLQGQAHQFTLFAALRLLEQTYASRPRLGESRHLHEDAVRLQQPPHLVFAPSDVKALSQDEELDRLNQLRDPTQSDFINLLQNRMMALFYRAWANADPATSLDRPDSDRFRQYLGAFIGLGLPSSWQQDHVHDYAKFSRTAWFGSRTRSVEGLEKVLSDYFGVPAQIHNFIGEWIQVPGPWRTRLGRRSSAERLSRRTAQGSTTLAGASLGARSWQCAHKFEIAIGPLSYAQFKSFLRGESALRELSDLVRLYTNDEWSWQLRLQLAAGEAPTASLGKARSQLGRTGWLRSHRQVVREVVIAGDAAQDHHQAALPAE